MISSVSTAQIILIIYTTGFLPEGFTFGMTGQTLRSCRQLRSFNTLTGTHGAVTKYKVRNTPPMQEVTYRWLSWFLVNFSPSNQ